MRRRTREQHLFLPNLAPFVIFLRAAKKAQLIARELFQKQTSSNAYIASGVDLKDVFLLRRKGEVCLKSLRLRK